ncbi:MAG: hypothetical protein Q9166_003929 [cf. Caloplaca sp. 2 TL-2023]
MEKSKELRFDAISKEASSSAAYDPLISRLFNSSLGPVEPTLTTATPTIFLDNPSIIHSNSPGDKNNATASATNDNGTSEPPGSDVSSKSPTPSVSTLTSKVGFRRRRKRDRDEDNIEGMYMQRIHSEESKTAVGKDARHSNKRQKLETARAKADGSASPASAPSKVDLAERDHNSSPGVDVPQHESLALSREKVELEKSARTIFLANVSTSSITSKTAKKTLLDHLISFFHLLPVSDKAHKVESLRFRSTPFVSGVGPKKAAYAKKELMDMTTRSTNAYVVYTTQLAAREAVKRLNGTTILDRHLLVDSVAHPRKTDHRRCVFVGNLGFVDDDSQINAAKAEPQDQKPRKKREPSDIEEGLWRQFSEVGSVESVRVVRDANTRVGKGFAYVQFENENAVEKALAYNDTKFPPLLPRVLRVTRAKKITKNSLKKPQHAKKMDDAIPSKANYVPKIDSAAQSLSGRAGKLFGRAGAAHLKGRKGFSERPSAAVVRTPEQIVFEGYRASSKQGTGTRVRGLKKKQGKPGTRSSRRGAAFKAKGGKQAGTRA